MSTASKSSFQSVVKRYQTKNINLKCKCSSQIEDICVQKCGEPSLHCRNKQCKFSNQKHKFCKFIKLQGLTELLEKRFEYYRTFLQKIQQIEQDFITRIKNGRAKLYELVILRELDDDQIVMLQQIFIKNNVDSFQGTNIEDLYKKLILQKTLKESNEQDIIEFQSHLVRMQFQINKSRKRFRNIDPQQEFQEMTQIVNSEQVQQSRFIFDCFGPPKDINLLFRASQHEFSAAKFHQICDGVPNLLVLIKTEFGKIVGGFNSIGWNKPLQVQNQQNQQKSTHWYSIAAEDQDNCFVFSVSLKQQMDLKNPLHAIKYSKNQGPIFGCDICISDKCNQNKKSSSFFPNSYNFTQNPYQLRMENMSRWQQLFGCSEYTFNVVQYEVFQLIF